MPLSGGAGSAGSAVCGAGPTRPESGWWAHERRRLRCRFQAVPALPAPPSAPLARRAGIRHGGQMSDGYVLQEEGGSINVTSSALAQIVQRAAESVDGARVRRPRRGLDLRLDDGRAHVDLELAARL